MRRKMCLKNFDFDVRDKKVLLNAQADALSHLRLLVINTVPVIADISTYPLYSDVKSTYRNSMDDLDTYSELITNYSLPFVPITFDEIRLSHDTDDFGCTIRARFHMEEWLSHALNGDSILFCTVDGYEKVIIPQSIVPCVCISRQNCRTTG